MLSQVRAALVRADPAFIVFALLAYVVSVPIVTLRWRVCLNGVTGGRLPFRPLLLAYLASVFVNNVTPAARLSGEACRVVALVRFGFTTVTKATAAAAYERLSELPTLALMVFVTLALVGRRSISPWLVAALALVVVMLFLVRGPITRAWQRLQDRWHRLESIRIAPTAVVVSALLTVVVWGIDVLRLRAVAAAFHAPISMPQAVALATITILGGLVPTIGGLGAIEGGLVAGLVAFGVSAADAVAITAVERGISYGIATLTGFGALSLLGGRSLWNAVRTAKG